MQKKQRIKLSREASKVEVKGMIQADPLPMVRKTIPDEKKPV